ncbi:MAG: DUF1559 domain-containing protein [Armatimonadota bacterium]|nr:DUF1559 domain-containing protein [bacterium]
MYTKQNAVSHHSRQRGSWLINVIIIVCIVLVVAAILLPTFQRTHCSARMSDCQSNLKEIAIALQIYWGDYDATLPSSALVSHSKTWNRNDFKKFATMRGDLSPVNRPQTYTQVLYCYMKNNDILYCPSDLSDHSKASSQVSYWWKCAIDKAWYGGKGRKPCHIEKDFMYNADEIVFYERSSFHEGNTSGLRNGDQINVAYLDTHVKSIAIKNGPSRTTQDPTAPGEPMHFNYDFNSNKPVVDSRGRAIGQTPATQGDKL